MSATKYTTIPKYNAALDKDDKKIANRLKKEIDQSLKGAESKIWHGNPVWFIHGNPITGYAKLKDCIQLLFWSGQSFGVPGLEPEGTFKAAQKRYTSSSEVKTAELRRWLKKSKTVQWDYKNIVKRRGKLIRLK